MAKSPSKTAARRAGPTAPRQRSCFVVTGFGNKTDYATGRVLNLDKTYEQLVRPACDQVNVNCFRAIDANLSGSINSVMYRWIYHADIVIADLSTLNANVFYELGVRHAQRPNTTIIIAESVLLQRIPFDLSSFVIHKYEHGGEAIAEAEQQRFVAHLAKVMAEILAVEDRRLQSAPGTPAETDSPVFRYLIGMTPPGYQAESYLEAPAYVPPAARATQQPVAGKTLASLIEAAEAAKKAKRFDDAVRGFSDAIAVQTAGDPEPGKPDRKPDVYLVQRLALVTYKAGEARDADGQVDVARATAALIEAEQILARHCAPKISNDPETLGLSGAINKRRFELSGDAAFLDRAIGFYERGFFVKQDYYNGINVAYMYTQRANLLADRFDAIVSYGHANMIRRQVAAICQELIDDEAGFAGRGDQEWVYLSLAEAFQGLERDADLQRLAPTIDRLASDFGKSSYLEQQAKLAQAMADFKRRVRPDELQAGAAGTDAASPSTASTAPAAGAAAQRPAAAGAARAITIDADILPGRQIKSIKVHCKINYG